VALAEAWHPPNLSRGVFFLGLLVVADLNNWYSSRPFSKKEFLFPSPLAFHRNSGALREALLSRVLFSPLWRRSLIFPRSICIPRVCLLHGVLLAAPSRWRWLTRHARMAMLHVLFYFFFQDFQGVFAGCFFFGLFKISGSFGEDLRSLMLSAFGLPSSSFPKTSFFVMRGGLSIPGLSPVVCTPVVS